MLLYLCLPFIFIPRAVYLSSHAANGLAVTQGLDSDGHCLSHYLVCLVADSHCQTQTTDEEEPSGEPNEGQNSCF